MADTPRTQTDLLTNLFQDGRAASSITEQDMRDFIVSVTGRAGWADYNDLATATTPISVTGGGGAVFLTNDEAGAFTNKRWIASGVTDVWDATLNQFDFTELTLNDHVLIRLDLEVTTTVANQEYEIDLEAATGTGGAYDIHFVTGAHKSSGTYKVNRLNAVYMGDTSTLNNPAKFKISSANNMTVKVNGWWCLVGKY